MHQDPILRNLAILQLISDTWIAVSTTRAWRRRTAGSRHIYYMPQCVRRAASRGTGTSSIYMARFASCDVARYMHMYMYMSYVCDNVDRLAVVERMNGGLLAHRTSLRCVSHLLLHSACVMRMCCGVGLSMCGRCISQHHRPARPSRVHNLLPAAKKSTKRHGSQLVLVKLIIHYVAPLGFTPTPRWPWPKNRKLCSEHMDGEIVLVA